MHKYLHSAFDLRIKQTFWYARSCSWRVRSFTRAEELCIQWHRVTFQKTWIFRNTAVGTSDLTCRKWCAESCCHQAFLCLMVLV